ncbi:MAG: class I SAM-dependent methyltransferase [Syntrophobacteraceae bacterium]|nr:class I SAM-dependent methyltransferase [Syntrophobacteraceae bacterium]
MISTIDWNELWRSTQAKKHGGVVREPTFWDRRAPEFSRHAAASDYIGQFLDIMKPEPQWSVLDIGCAAGTLAVPLSPAVTSITALDPSPVMLSLLEKRCRNHEIGNIRAVRGRWQDDWEKLGIGVHDVAIASRSLIVDDLREAVLKLEGRARKRVYLAALVEDGPFDRRVVEAAGRKCSPGPDYTIVYNLLRQMGIYANVAITLTRNDQSYCSVEEALDAMRWMIYEMTPKEEENIRNYLRGCLVQEEGRWRLPYPRIERWAVIWWNRKIDV